MKYSVNYLKDFQSLRSFLKFGSVLFCLLMAVTGYSKDVGLHKTAGFRPFVTTWSTDSPESLNSNQITIPTIGTGYNYKIYWEDTVNSAINGTISGITGDYTITFPKAGIYRVEISGDFPRIYFNGQGDKLKIWDIIQWGDVVWQSMGSAFRGCDYMNIIASDSPNLSMVTDMSYMFKDARLYFNGPIGNWDVSNVTNMSGMFSGALSFNQPLNSWDVSNVTNMSGMFSDAPGFNQPLNSWNVGKVADMSGMFNNAISFNQPISSWNVGNVSNMSSMFNGTLGFNQPISSWDVSKVADMSRMFEWTENFNQPIGNWNVGNVTNMHSMFDSATSFNQPISNWDLSKVRDMSNMFKSAENFNQPIGDWNIGIVSNMHSMFESARSFNQPISKWDVSKVTDMSYMFREAINFNQPIGAWNVGNVTDMSNMFGYAYHFNQPIGSWDVSKVTHMDHMLDFTGISRFNYDLLLQSWAANLNGLPKGVTLGAAELPYCNGAAARNTLITKYGWVIEGDYLDCDALGTMDASEASAIKIYPNPAQDYIDIDLGGNSITDMFIIDMSGREVLKINNDSQRVNIASLDSGVYYLVAHDLDKTMHYKIVKD